MTNPSADCLVTVGRIVGLFGVSGWVKVHSHTRPRAAILKYNPWRLRLKDGWKEVALRDGRMQGKGVVASLAGCDDRETARGLIGVDIALAIAQLPQPGRGEFYWAQLEGLEVVNRAGATLGRVSHLFETGANDVLVVRNGRERLIPYTAPVIEGVDLEAGVIRVDWEDDET